MAAAKQGDTVRVHYKGSLDDGRQFDSSDGRDPLEFTVGSGQVIPGFDSALQGMSVGEEKTVTIPCADAYGPHQAQMVQEVERNAIPDDIPLSIGTELAATDDRGGQMRLTVIALNEQTVTLDANHPLAGEDLTFDLKLVEIV